MKRFTSKYLRWIAISYLAFPLWYILCVVVLFDVPGNLSIRVLLSPLYYLAAFIAVAVGYGLLETKRWAWYWLIVSDILIGYENAIWVQDYGETHHKFLAFAASIFVLVGVTMFVRKEIRVPYFFPKIRWWESNPRYRLAVPVTLSLHGESLGGEILDLSLGGCFIKLAPDLDVEDDVSLFFSLYGHRIQCSGTVVWHTNSTVTHPKGVGVKFGPLGKQQKRDLRLILKRLKKLTVLYRTSRYLLSQEEFSKRVREIEGEVSE